MSKNAPVAAGNNSPIIGLAFAAVSFGIFSTHDVFVKILGADFSVFQIIFFSALFSFVPMTVVMSADRAVDNFRPHNIPLIALRSILNIVGMASAFYAFTVLPMTEVYAIIFATPLLITVLAVPILGETIRLPRGLAVVTGLIGVIIVLRPGVAELTLGHVAALTTAITGAFSALIVRKLGNSERTAVLVLYPMIASIIVTGALLPATYIPFDLASLGLAAVIGIFAITAQFMIVIAYRAAPAAVVAPMQYSQIIWATFYGWILFNELPDKWVIIGTSVIVASGLFIVWRETRINISNNRPVLGAHNMRPDMGPSPKPKNDPVPAEG